MPFLEECWTASGAHERYFLATLAILCVILLVLVVIMVCMFSRASPLRRLLRRRRQRRRQNTEGGSGGGSGIAMTRNVRSANSLPDEFEMPIGMEWGSERRAGKPHYSVSPIVPTEQPNDRR